MLLGTFQGEALRVVRALISIMAVGGALVLAAKTPKYLGKPNATKYY